MRRRLWGEIEFAQCHIPMQKTLLQRELCRYDLRLRSELTVLKCQIHSHMLIRGWKLTREYPNIVCTAALRELNAADIDIFRFDVAKAKYLKQLVAETDRALRARMETNRMFDLAGQKRREVPPDLMDYVMKRPYIITALRRARDAGAGEEEWMKIIADLERRAKWRKRR